MKRWWLIPVVISVLLLAFYVARSAKGKRIPVMVDIVRRSDISENVSAFGSIQPKEEVNISANVSARIVHLYVDEGDTVSFGDTLVQLDKKRFEAIYEQAEASLRSAEAQARQAEATLRKASDEFARAETLYQKKLISYDDYLEAKTSFEIAEAQYQSACEQVSRARGQVDEALENLNETVIISPTDGVVVSLNAEEGEIVLVGTMNNPGTVIMRIADLSNMEAKLEVDETDVVDLAPGQLASVTVDALPDTTLSARLIQVSNYATTTGGQEQVANFEVLLAIMDDISELRPGMSCSAEITTREKSDVLVVPIQSVVYREGREVVFVVEDGVARERPVKTGIADNVNIEIESGIEEGETVITGSYKVLRTIQDGDKVLPQNIPKKGKHLPRGAKAKLRPPISKRG
ncbi:efflux RND transporter periplasmic adaptor subunit [bacterium]|nr:efflux RND transporter periplasmic adaptor subunit [bacterium]